MSDFHTRVQSSRPFKMATATPKASKPAFELDLYHGILFGVTSLGAAIMFYAILGYSQPASATSPAPQIKAQPAMPGS